MFAEKPQRYPGNSRDQRDENDPSNRWVKKLKQRKTGILSSSGVARSGGATTICRTLNLVHRNGYEPINDWSLTDWAPVAENYHKISNALL
jgi:hypothetical protein